MHMNSGMENQKNITNEEYETQFFGFAPTDLYEGITELIHERFESTICKLEKEMKKIPKEILPENEVTEGISNLRSMTNEYINNTLLRVKEHLLSKIFKIPSNLLLPEDVDQSSPCSDEEVKKLKKEIEELQVQLKSEKFMEAILAEELKDIEIVLKAQTKFLEFAASKRPHWEEQKQNLEFMSENSNAILKTFEILQQENNSELRELTSDALEKMYLQ